MGDIFVNLQFVICEDDLDHNLGATKGQKIRSMGKNIWMFLTNFLTKLLLVYLSTVIVLSCDIFLVEKKEKKETQIEFFHDREDFEFQCEGSECRVHFVIERIFLTMLNVKFFLKIKSPSLL